MRVAAEGRRWIHLGADDEVAEDTGWENFFVWSSVSDFSWVEGIAGLFAAESASAIDIIFLNVETELAWVCFTSVSHTPELSLDTSSVTWVSSADASAHLSEGKETTFEAR